MLSLKNDIKLVSINFKEISKKKISYYFWNKSKIRYNKPSLFLKNKYIL
jgi:hypothetical protein